MSSMWLNLVVHFYADVLHLPDGATLNIHSTRSYSPQDDELSIKVII